MDLNFPGFFGRKPRNDGVTSTFSQVLNLDGFQPRSGVFLSPGEAEGEPWERGRSEIKPRQGRLTLIEDIFSVIVNSMTFQQGKQSSSNVIFR
jgi:hypothetical protein